MLCTNFRSQGAYGAESGCGDSEDVARDEKSRPAP